MSEAPDEESGTDAVGKYGMEIFEIEEATIIGTTDHADRR